MPTTIACRACHSPLLLRPDSLGHAVRCPGCGNTFVVTQADILVADKQAGPGAPTTPTRSAPQRPALQRAPAGPRSASPRSVACPACQEPMLDDGTLAGQMVQCVHCSQMFQMPGRSPRAASGRYLARESGSSQSWHSYVFAGAILTVMALAVTVIVAIQQRVTPDPAAEQPDNHPVAASTGATTIAEVSPLVASAPQVRPLNVPPPELSPRRPDATVPDAAPVDSGRAPQPDTPAAGNAADTSAKQGTVKEVVDRVDPSIVRISIPNIGLGSGFVVDDKGTIVTNYHVIAGATRAIVVFSDKTQAEVTGFTAVIPDMDLAALRIVPPRSLRPLPLAKSRPAKGEQVLAFGAPQGLSFSVSDGIVSAVRPGQEVQEILKETSGRDVYRTQLGYSLDMTWVQTSTPISPGNSGGPLVNLAGEVVGVNTWSRTGENLNFAVAAEHVSALLQQASSSAQPFSQLPKPRVQVVRISKSQAERTQQYWDKIYDAHQEMLAKDKKEKKKPTDGARWLATARRLRRFAVTVKRLDVRDVDLELVVLATKLAQNVEEIAAALEDGANALPKGKLDARTARSNGYKFAYQRYQWLTGSNRRLCSEFDYLRVAFAVTYGTDFRVIFDLDADDEDGLTEKEKD